MTCCLVSIYVVVCLVVKPLVSFCKAEKYSHISFYTYHIAHTYNCKITLFFFFLPNLQFEKLKHCPILLMLDWFHA